MHGRSICAALRRTMTGEMLRLGDHAVVAAQVLPLCSQDIRQSELASQVGVFPVILLDTPPTRLAGKVQDGTKNHAHSGRARLSGDGCAYLLHNLWIPSSSKANRSWKYCPCIETVQSFFDKKRWNGEAIVCENPLLNGVCLFRGRVQVVDSANTEISPHLLCSVGKEMSCGSSVRFIRMLI